MRWSILAFGVPGLLGAQPVVSERADAEARIFVVQELLLNRVQDLHFGTIIAGERGVEVDPRTSPNAGKFLLQFDDTQEWSIRYEASERLEPVNGVPGAAGLPFEPEIYGHSGDDPAAAMPIEPEVETYRTRDGVFYFWIGGQVDAGAATPGVYTGVFTLTVEPL